MQILAAVAGTIMMICKIGGAIAFWPCVYILMKAAATEAFRECCGEKEKLAYGKEEKPEPQAKEKKRKEIL